MTDPKKPLDYASRSDDGQRPAHGCLLVIAVLGSLPLLLGGRWLYLFIFTDYRAHHRPVMIPLGLFTVLVGGAMVLLPVLLRRRR